MPDVSVIIPAYREGSIIGEVVEKTRRVMEATGHSFEIIVVDDGSDDETPLQAEKAAVRVIRHPYNIGNGAAVKTGIRNARGRIFVTMDGDGQHNPADIPRLLEHIEHYDMVVGARTGDSESQFHRNLANRVYNLFASYICKRKIKDLTSGFRAIRADVAKQFLALLPNSFSYPTTITMGVIRAGFSLAYVPVTTSRRVGKSKIRLLGDGSRFLLIIIKIATLFSPLRVFLPVSAVMFLGGLGYGIFRIIFMGGRYGPTSSMLMTMAVVIFMVGLVSEQIAQLRYDRSERRD